MAGRRPHRAGSLTVLAGALSVLAVALGLCAAVAVVMVVLGAASVQRFSGPARVPPARLPPVTVLKPLCGHEPMLEAALATICAQSYAGAMQVVFGVQDAADPALHAVAAVRRRFPGCDVAVVVDPRLHGPNRKVSNLLNMLPAARHDLLLCSDSDLHVPPNYVEQVVVAMAVPGVGLVTTVCAGLPTSPETVGRATVGRLGAMAITHTFLPGALMARQLGRQDCLGTTMAIRRDVLAGVGGLHALVRHLADDHMLACKVKQAGFQVGLAAVVPMTGVPEQTLGALLQHELRWTRTIRAVEPKLFVASTLQFPLFWSAAAAAASGGAAWAVVLFAVAWAVRAGAARVVDGLLRLPPIRGGAAAIWLLLLPVRDMISALEVAASYLSHRVVWRGRVMHADQRMAAGPDGS